MNAFEPEQCRWRLWLFMLLPFFRPATSTAAADSVFATKPAILQEQGAGEGPAWHPTLGLLTSGGGHIYRRDREGNVSVYRPDAGSNGLLFDRQGLEQEDAQGRKVEGVYRIDPSGAVVRVLGAEVQRANGLVVTAGGSLWRMRVHEPGAPVWPARHPQP